MSNLTITPSVTSGGSISPANVWHLAEGSTIIFYFEPDAGFHVEEVLVDGVPVIPESEGEYEFARVTHDHTISVEFASNEPAPED